MFTIKPCVTVAAYGDDVLTAKFEVTGPDDTFVVLNVHELAILVRDAAQALAESVSMVEREYQRLQLESLKRNVASRSVE